MEKLCFNNWQTFSYSKAVRIAWQSSPKKKKKSIKQMELKHRRFYNLSPIRTNRYQADAIKLLMLNWGTQQKLARVSQESFVGHAQKTKTRKLLISRKHARITKMLLSHRVNSFSIPDSPCATWKSSFRQSYALEWRHSDGFAVWVSFSLCHKNGEKFREICVA